MGDKEPQRDLATTLACRRPPRFCYHEATVNGAFGRDSNAFCPVSYFVVIILKLN